MLDQFMRMAVLATVVRRAIAALQAHLAEQAP